MSQAMKQVIEYSGIPVGILVPENDRFKFIAVKFHVYDLDGQYFPSAMHVLQAIHNIISPAIDRRLRAA